MSTWSIALIIIVIIALVVIIGTIHKALNNGIGFFEALGESLGDLMDYIDGGDSDGGYDSDD